MSVRDKKSVPYMRDRKLVERNGYLVIFSSDEPMPICCPVCSVVFRSKFDEDEFKKLNCCENCAKNWAYPNIEKWKNGWRPDKNEIESLPRQSIEFQLKID